MRGRGGDAVLSIRGANLAAPSSVTAFGRATFPLKGGRLLSAFCYVAEKARAEPLPYIGRVSEILRRVWSFIFHQRLFS